MRNMDKSYIVILYSSVYCFYTTFLVFFFFVTVNKHRKVLYLLFWMHLTLFWILTTCLWIELRDYCPFPVQLQKKNIYIYMKNFTGTRAKIRISLAQVMLTKKVVLLPSKNWKCYRNKEVASHVKGLAMCYAHALTRHAPFHPRAHS